MNIEKREFTPVKLIRDKGEFFFGYYDKCPWNASMQYVLAHQVSFSFREPTEKDYVSIGIVESKGSGKFKVLTKTAAWSWQQGAMLQWWPGDPENVIMFNDRRDGKYVSVLHDIHKGEIKVLPRPVSAVSKDGRNALSLNYARLDDLRPGYGYKGISDSFADQLTPQADGIYRMDIQTGKYELIVSVQQIAAIGRNKSMEGVKHWFNHTLFSPDGKRIVFLHRWRRQGQKGQYTRMFTCNIDGSDLYCLNDHDMVSHFDWGDKQTIIAFARRFRLGDHYYQFTDQTENVVKIGGDEFSKYYDGHCTYCPEREWILSDSYPDENNYRRILLYHIQTGRIFEVCKFEDHHFSSDIIGGGMGCDLHPRWSPDGRQICVDSVKDGTRQIYLIELDKSALLETR